jgi:hypothetical protein
MTDDHLQRHADLLAARVEALAEALRDGGIAEDVSAQLLSRASAAVLQALNLEALRASVTSASDRKRVPAQASYCVVFDASDAPFRTLATFKAAA